MRGLDDAWLVQRRELVRAVQGVSGGIVQLVAPRGYGKSVLLQQASRRPPGQGRLVAGRALTDVPAAARAVAEALATVDLAGIDPSPSSLLERLVDGLGDRSLLLAVDDIFDASDEVRSFLISLVQARPRQVRLVVAARTSWEEPYRRCTSDVELVLLDADHLLLSRKEMEGLRGVVRASIGRDQIHEETRGWPAAMHAAVGRAIGAIWAADEVEKLAQLINRAVLHELSAAQCALLKVAARTGVVIPRAFFLAAGTANEPTWLSFPLLEQVTHPYPGLRPIGLLREAIQRRAEDQTPVAVVMEELARHLCDLESFEDAVKVAAELEPEQRADLLLYLGPALVLQGKDAEALAAFESFTNADLARWPTLVLARGVMSGLRGETSETMGWLQEYANHAATHRERSELGKLVITITEQFLGSHPTLIRVEAGPPGWPRMLMHLIASFVAYQDGDGETAVHHQIVIYRTSEAYPLMRVFACASLGFLYLRRGSLDDAERMLGVAHGLALREQLGQANSTALINAASAWLHFLRNDDKTGMAHVQQAIRKIEAMPHGDPLTIALCQIALLEGALLTGSPQVRAMVGEFVTRAKPPIGGRTGTELDALLARLAQSQELTKQSGPLTRAEMHVLQHLSSHLSLPQIAAQLHLSPATVRSHAHAIYRKFGVNSRADAVEEGRRLMLLPPQ